MLYSFGVVLVAMRLVLPFAMRPCCCYPCFVSESVCLHLFSCCFFRFPVVVKVMHFAIAWSMFPLPPYGMHSWLLSAMAVRARSVGAGFQLRYKNWAGAIGTLLLAHGRVARPRPSGLATPMAQPGVLGRFQLSPPIGVLWAGSCFVMGSAYCSSSARSLILAKLCFCLVYLSFLSLLSCPCLSQVISARMHGTEKGILRFRRHAGVGALGSIRDILHSAPSYSCYRL